MTVTKPSDEDLEFATNSAPAAGRRTIEILRQHRLWADEQIAQLLERNTNQAKSIAELREEADNLRDENAKHRSDYRRRGEELTEAARINDRQQRVISRMEVSHAATENRLREDLTAARTPRATAPGTALHEYAETAFGRKSTPLDKEVQVIQECLTAMDELDASKRSSIAQYLLSRAQTTAQQAPGLGGQW